MEEKVLKFFYDKFPNPMVISFTGIPIQKLGLDLGEDLLEFEQIMDQLKDNYHIEQNRGLISITFKGVFYYEEKYLRPNYYYTKAVSVILEFLEKLENGEYNKNTIPNSEIITTLNKEGISFDNKQFYEFLIALESRTDLFKNIGPFGIMEEHYIPIMIKNKPVLTPKGRKFIQIWREYNQQKNGRFGKWKILKTINKGGQGVIFKVQKEAEDVYYALKSYRTRGNSKFQKKKVKRFQSEVEALKTIKDCNNVIKLIDEGGVIKNIGFSDHYFIMELADTDLSKYVETSSQVDIDKIIEYYRQILDGFECIHKHKIVHRDIKPSNILLKDNSIKISDFGINYQESDHRITQTGEITGPKFFLCPESEDGRLEMPDIKCDIYSLGKLLYYLLSNGKYFAREKFEGEDYNLIKIHNDYRFSSFIPFFRKTMTEDINERYSNISELRNGFEKCIKRFNVIPIFIELYFFEQPLLEQCPKFILEDEYSFNNWISLYFLIKIMLANFNLPFFVESQIQNGYRYGISCIFFNVIDLQAFKSKLNESSCYYEISYYEGDISFNNDIVELADAVNYKEKIDLLIKDFSITNEERFHEYLYNRDKFYTLLDAYIGIL